MYVKKTLYIFLIAFIFFSQCACGRREIVLERVTESRGTETEGKSRAVPAGDRSDGAAAVEKQTEKKISVFVCGAVLKPGVYQLPAGSRAEDAVMCAGGFASGADREWCNLARVVNDGEKLVIYTLEETAKMEAQGQAAEGTADADTPGDPANGGGKVNINTAGREELMTLSGIGETRAKAIIEYSTAHGNFSAPEDIMLVPGIKGSIYASLKDRICVN